MSDTNRAQTASNFVHLHNHSHYSLLDGLQKIPEMLDRVKAMGMPAVAVTDHGTLSGVIELYKEAKKRDIKPIFGVEVYMAPRALNEKAGKLDANPYHLILLAENFQGYQNLMELVTTAHLEGFYYKPRIDRELLAKHKEGLVVLSACASGEVASHIRSGVMEKAEEVVRWYQEVFGPENYFLELQDHEHEWKEQQLINDGLMKLAKKTGAPLVLTADSHYCKPEDREAHEILLCVQTGRTIHDKDRMTMDMSLYVSDPKEIAERWQSRCPEAIANTLKIAEKCNVELELGGILIPRFEVPTGETERQYLHKLCWQGLMWRYGNIPKEDMSLITEERARKELDPKIVERVDFELGVIGNMSYEGYFLIVADFINWGKNRGIIFGPGRGSAAGSIVAYAMNITDLDPITYDLFFERFLNPDRITMPDIDVDIQDSRREEVIAYVTEKYGQDRVAQIITFGTMAARNAVRDTGRVLGMPYGEVDALAKLIPQPVQGRHIPLAVSIKEDPELRREYQGNPRAKKLIDMAMKLEGTIRSNGVHAAGVVIAPEKIVKYTPLQRAQKGGVSTQYSMGPIEDLGLIKMDFLGLSNLTIIKNTLRIIKKVHGVSISIGEISLEDATTYELLSRGDTTGVFQLESAGMKRYLRELKPTKFDDIIAMCALYRPGPMQFIDDFIDRKHGRKEVIYEHAGMEAALKNTYGILVYQEQFMQISKDMCGFTGGMADTLRKAIGKKQRDTMAKMRTLFIDGMVEHSKVDQKFAEKFWSQLEAFADYCFNKSHSACYGLIAYQTAYLKAHFPSAFMAALMTSNHDNTDKIAMEVAECRRVGIEVLPPDVNESFLEFGVVLDTGKIRFGLSAVKNVGSGAIEAILAAREEGGVFKSVEDFAKRVNAAEVNRKVWESLIKCGAFDSLEDRNKLLANLETIMGYAGKAQKDALSGQIDIFGSMGMEIELPPLSLEEPSELVTPREMLMWEKELLGLYLSSHPLDDYDAYLEDTTSAIGAITQQDEGKLVKVGGIITTSKRITTKKNASMAFAVLEDKTGEVELVVFPKAYEKEPELWEADSIIMATGKISFRDRDGRMSSEAKIMVESAKILDYESIKGYQRQRPKREFVRPEYSQLTPKPVEDEKGITISLGDTTDIAILTKIKEVLNSSPGEEKVYLVLGSQGTKKICLPQKVTPSPELLQKLEEIVGKTSVRA